MRILITESSLNWGGQQLRILIEMQELIRRGHQVWLTANQESQIYQKAIERQLPVFPSNQTRAANPFVLAQLAHWIKKYQIEILHSHSNKDRNGSSLLKFFMPKLKVIFTRHIVQELKPGFFHAFPWRYGCDVIKVVAEVIGKQLTNDYHISPDKIFNTGTFADPKDFYPEIDGKIVRQEFKIPDASSTAGIIGMFRHDKGHRYFLEAAFELLKTNPEAHFLVVGSSVNQGRNELEKDMKQWSAQLPLGKQIHFLGYRQDVPQCMAAMDVVVVASIGTEAQSLIIPQAYAMAKPVIGTTVGGIPEVIVDGKTGFLVPAKNSSAIAKSIAELWQNKPLALSLGQQGYQLFLEEMTFSRNVDKVEQAYHRMLDSTRSSIALLM